jgi:hypothetical protein
MNKEGWRQVERVRCSGRGITPSCWTSVIWRKQRCGLWKPNPSGLHCGDCDVLHAVGRQWIPVEEPSAVIGRGSHYEATRGSTQLGYDFNGGPPHARSYPESASAMPLKIYGEGRKPLGIGMYFICKTGWTSGIPSETSDSINEYEIVRRFSWKSNRIRSKRIEQVIKTIYRIFNDF